MPNLQIDTLDLPAWIQAFAALTALNVTAFQWWSVRQDVARERLARQRAAATILISAYAALAQQGERMAHVADPGSGPAVETQDSTRILQEARDRQVGLYAQAMLDSGFDVITRTTDTIDLSILKPHGVEAVMTARTVLHGIRVALEDIAKPSKVMPVPMFLRLSFFERGLTDLRDAVDALERSIAPRRRWRPAKKDAPM